MIYKESFNPGRYIKALKGLKGLKAFGTTNTAKFVRGAATAFKGKGGWTKGITELAKHKAPLHVLSKGELVGAKVLGSPIVTAKSSLASGFRTSVGNLAENVRILQEGVAKGGVKAPFIAAKNFSTLVGKQFRGSSYKIVDLKKAVTKTVTDKKTGLVSKKYFYKPSLGFKREILGKTTTGMGIVAKRKASLPLTALGSGPAMGVFEYSATGNKPKRKQISGALGTAAIWTAAPQVAFTKGMYNIAKNIYSK